VGDVVGIPLPEQERYVSRKELAEIMGVSVRTIDTFRAEGMPAESWGLRAVRFSPSKAIAWARARTGKEAA
jgi:phage terminase Nu1 subunit (DNA packaging protein)